MVLRGFVLLSLFGVVMSNMGGPDMHTRTCDWFLCGIGFWKDCIHIYKTGYHWGGGDKSLSST